MSGVVVGDVGVHPIVPDRASRMLRLPCRDSAGTPASCPWPGFGRLGEPSRSPTWPPRCHACGSSRAARQARCRCDCGMPVEVVGAASGWPRCDMIRGEYGSSRPPTSTSAASGSLRSRTPRPLAPLFARPDAACGPRAECLGVAATSAPSYSGSGPAQSVDGKIVPRTAHSNNGGRGATVQERRLRRVPPAGFSPPAPFSAEKANFEWLCVGRSAQETFWERSSSRLLT